MSDGKTTAILDGGLAYIIGQNLQVDASFGTRVHGETGPQPFLAFGISWRWKPSHAKHQRTKVPKAHKSHGLIRDSLQHRPYEQH